jgi:hypothetical protein
LSTSLPDTIKRQLQLKPGLSYKHFLAAVKVGGFREIKKFTKDKSLAICLSRSFWLMFTHYRKYTHSVNFLMNENQVGRKSCCSIFLCRQRPSAPSGNETKQAVRSFFQFITNLGADRLDFNNNAQLILRFHFPPIHFSTLSWPTVFQRH